MGKIQQKCNPGTNPDILSIDLWQRDYCNTTKKAWTFSTNDAREIGYSSRKKDKIDPYVMIHSLI